MNSYEFHAAFKRDRAVLQINGRVGGEISGNPDLDRVATEVSGELLLRLIFRPFTQHHSCGFCWLIKKDELPTPLRHIRILLPDYQEFVLLSKSENPPHHPIAKGCTYYRTGDD